MKEMYKSTRESQEEPTSDSLNHDELVSHSVKELVEVRERNSGERNDR